MRIEPSYDAFRASYERGLPQVVWTRLVADLETPVSAYLKVAEGRPLSFLLESVEGGAVRGRYSMIGLAPDLVWRCAGGVAELAETVNGEAADFAACNEAPLAALRSILQASRIALPADLPPMAAGMFGYLGYDMVREMERLAEPKPDPIGVPDALLIRPTLMLVFDAVKDEVTVVTPVRPQEGQDAKAAFVDAERRLASVVDALDRPLEKASDSHDPMPIEPRSNTAPEVYEAMVARGKDYIAAGDVFQVVLGQRFSAPFFLPPFALYRALRRTNPSPFLFHLDFGEFAVVGSSPEILVRVRDEEVTIRPLAGTRRRGDTQDEDRHLAEELLADPKERAEHLMLLDLGRNDVGRVAELGTVRVTDQFTLEFYSHVMHIVSNVVGRLDPAHDALDALVAGFPAGTVSGAPKVRAMQIIDELELDKRGIYAGCVGYFSADGAMDTCIVLRTAVLKDDMMHVQAGAGIVYDSVPEAEQAECVAKARALFRAAEEAVRFAASGARQTAGAAE